VRVDIMFPLTFVLSPRGEEINISCKIKTAERRIDLSFLVA
jgi:hypothetical protein